MSPDAEANSQLGQIRLSGFSPLPPDPTLPEVLTRSEYPLAHAVAELVDNSIDSGARRVVVRLIRSAHRLQALQVLDDGNGIDPSIFDKIMRFGYKSPHKLRDIGMYGVGLKTSSLSQAEVLLVVSRVSGKAPAGRQLVKSELSKQQLGVIESVDAKACFNSSMKNHQSAFVSEYGTVVEWREVKDFLRSEEGVESYLKTALLDLDSHLGLVFHRFIERKQCVVMLEVQQGPSIVSRVPVRAVNPFNYPKSGVRGWPKPMTLKIARGSGMKPLIVTANAHIWPPRTKVPEYKIRRVGGRANTIDSQGLYFYFNDRLLIAGGWSSIRTPEAHLALARMEITLTRELQEIVEIVYTKDKAMVPLSFIRALRSATSPDGSTYSRWIDLAQETFRTPSATEPKLPTLPLPGAGMPDELRESIERAGFPKGERIKLKWAKLSSGQIFRVDRKRKLLLVNEEHRRKLLRRLGGEAGLEVAVTLLYHSLREHFGDRSTEKLKRLEEMMNESIIAVVS
jgi:hypothetical protein